jgi:hypothetical protein
MSRAPSGSNSIRLNVNIIMETSTSGVHAAEQSKSKKDSQGSSLDSTS